MKKFELDFCRLFDDWKNEWIKREEMEPLPRITFLKEISPELHERNKMEDIARDCLIDFTSKYCMANKSNIDKTFFNRLNLLFGGCFGNSCDKQHIDFLHRVCVKIVNSIEVS